MALNMTSNEPAKKTGILFSCSLGSARDVERQIRAGCDINEKDDFGVPAIIIAARKNKAEIVKLLVDAGVDINNAKSPRGETVAYWAKKHKNKAMESLVGIKDEETTTEQLLPILRGNH